MRIAIRGGRVYDPQNGVDGEVATVHIEDGRIVGEQPGEFREDKTIDATGRVVFPGGVDMHCHIAGPAVNRARRFVSAACVHEPDRDGRPVAFPLVPSPEATGLRYSMLGYTTAVDAAISPAGSRQCHLELSQTPNLDRAFLLLLANNEFLVDLLDSGETEAARAAVGQFLGRSGAFGIKAVNPGGVAEWKATASQITSFSAPLAGRRVSPRDVVQFLAATAEDLELPHPLHIHCNSLGIPGNIDVTLETSRALEGHRHHLAHVQFHSYGEDEHGDFASAAPRLVEHLRSHPEVTVDVGQVMFGPALTLSADEELEYRLWRLTGKPYVSVDGELEMGCGMVPLDYRHRSRVHALQWAIGLEIFLLCDDLWRLALSTDHPNGGSFVTYPALMAQLMSRDVRQAVLDALPRHVVSRGILRELSREYTLGDVATVTRAAPARILGLTHKGHLGPGADADVAVYDDCADREAMFRWPLFVLQAGEMVVENGELSDPTSGATLRVEPPADPSGWERFRDWFRHYGTYDAEQLGPDERTLRAATIVRREEGAEHSNP